MKTVKWLWIATLFCVAGCDVPSFNNKSVKFGAEVLLQDPKFRSKLAGKNVALFTNQAFVDAKMNSLILRYFEAKDFNLVSLFAKEHGVRGQYQAGANVPHEIDVETGIMIWSLYNSTAGWPGSPNADMFRTKNIPQELMRDAINKDLIKEVRPGEFEYKYDGELIDVILFDLPDIGSVAWTYLFSITELMKSIVEFELNWGHKIELFVLDRPNPLGGLVVEGPPRDTRPVAEGGIGTGSFWRFPLTSRYGMTLGEVAKMFAGEWIKDIEVTVIPVQNWTRDMYWDDWDPTGSRFILPSPNMPTWEAALAFSGMVWHEGTNIGERGTTPVWTLIHAPYIDGFAFAERLNRFVDCGILQGVRYRAASNTPLNSDSQHVSFPGRFSDGVEIHITDKHLYRAIDDVIIQSLVLGAMYGTAASNPADATGFSIRNSINVRIGNNVIREAIRNFPFGASDQEIIFEFNRLKDIIENGDPETGTPGNREFMVKRNHYLMKEYDVPVSKSVSHAPPLTPTVILGYEKLLESHRNLFKGKRVGLVADHTSVTKQSGHITDLLFALSEVNLTTLFAPVPGLRGLRQDVVLEGKDADERAFYPGGTTYIDKPTGLPVHRLAGAFTVPTVASLANVDLLLFDLWDSGVRFNSRIELLADVMRACAENRVALVVLDRPPMIDGEVVDGPVSETGKYAIPIRYGMTIGELAHLLKAVTESFGNLDLTIIKMEHWDRTAYTKESGLKFIAPYGTANSVNSLGHISPIKIGTYEAALAYSVTGLIEGTSLFDGLGTTRSMEAVGASFITPQLVPFKNALDALRIPGVDFRAVVHLPWKHIELSNHGGKYGGVNNTGGVQLHISNYKSFHTMETVLSILTTLRAMFPNDMNAATFIPPATGPVCFNEQIGNSWMQEMILAGESVTAIKARYAPALTRFKKLRSKHLIY